MIYVFPVSASDSHLIDPLCDVIGHLGGMKGRRAVVVADPQASQAAGHLNDRLLKLDAKSELYVFPQNCNEGWPTACNRYFAFAVSHLTRKLAIQEPFFWFELDNTPIKQDWIERLGSEWGLAAEAKKPFMGVLRQYYVKNNVGQIVPQGLIMNGSAAYHHQFGHASILLRSVIRSGMPWDVFMRNELCGGESKPRVHDISRFVCFNWSSKNFRRENGEIAFYLNPRPEGMIANDKKFPITAETVLVHGCKDSSLAKLILAEAPLKGAEVAQAAAKPSEQKKGPIIIPQAPERPENVRSLIAELLSIDGRLPEGSQAPIVEQALSQGGQVVPSRQPHKLEIVGSNPTPAILRKVRGEKAPQKKQKRNVSPAVREAAAERMRKFHANKKLKALAAA